MESAKSSSLRASARLQLAQPNPYLGGGNFSQSCLAENGSDAHVGVLHIGSRVAIEREQLFPAEDVIEIPVLGEIRIFQGTEYSTILSQGHPILLG